MAVLVASPYAPSALAAQGKTLFAQHSCASCHCGAIATDSPAGVRHDVGTIDLASGQRGDGLLDGFDTPSLRGIWASARYLHDGSAASIDEAIMAYNSTVTIAEAAALAEYIRTLDASFTNLAPNKVVSQSSLAWGGFARYAIDGNNDGNWGNSTVSHTDLEQSPWLSVDLGKEHYIDRLRLWNRTDCCTERLVNFYVLVSEQPFESNDLNASLNQAGVKVIHHAGVAGRETEFDISGLGRYIRVQLAGQGILSLAELEVLGMAP